MRTAAATTLALLALAGCQPATTSPVTDTQDETYHSGDTPSAKRDRIYSTAKDECRYLRYGSHFSYERAIRTMRRDYRGDVAAPAALDGCTAAYK